MPISLWWDGTNIRQADAISKCVTASPSAFRLAAGLLMGEGMKIPDPLLNEDLDRMLDLNDELRQAYLEVGAALLSAAACSDGGGDTLFRLRADPSDECQIQQSFDGGSTWFDAYRLDACLTPADAMTYRQYNNTELTENNTFINNLVMTYDNDVTNIYPQAAYNGDAGLEDFYRDLALCYAITRAVDTVCDGVILGINEREAANGLVLLAIGAGVGLYILATIATAGTLALATAALSAGVSGTVLAGLGAGTGIAAWLNTVIANNTTEPFEDMDARQQVMCAWFDAMKGQTIGYTLYKDALNGHGLTGNAGIIADAIDGSNEVIENFASFLNLLNQSFAGASVGIITSANCGCELDAWAHVFEGSDLVTLWAVREEGNPVNETDTGAVSGNNWISVVGSSVMNISISIPVPNPPSLIGNVTATVVYSSPQGITTIQMQAKPNADYQDDAGFVFVSDTSGKSSGVNQTFQISLDANNMPLWLRIYIGGQVLNLTDVITVHKITVSGTGVDPFL